MAQKIVIVEDDPALGEVFEIGLTHAGFNVKRAWDGESGLQLIRNEKPDLVLLDLIMPKMNGFQVLQERTWCA